ncbi:MAG TPA: ATP-binding domain-containing protein [Armatimonadota bacterium]|nr:ATP-binding domain-containing protein [Armatimonadota bacterium]
MKTEIQQLAAPTPPNPQGDDWSGQVVQSYVKDSRALRLKSLRNVLPAPYFGRIDFASDQSTDVTVAYIGRSHIGVEPPVCDWRAPIGSVFYRFHSPGPASYMAPNGRVSGELLLKRTYEILRGKLFSVHDVSGEAIAGPSIDVDPMLLVLLGRQATARLREIVRSIQAEQDAVIRDEGAVLVVEGPAGSGKSVVALHRAAYTLYRLRNVSGSSLSAQQMLVVSPNRIFSRYISRVLPDLGEHSIRRAVPENIFNRQLENRLRKDDKAGRRAWNVEQRQDFHEFLLQTGEADSADVRLKCVELKWSVELCDALRRYSEYIQGGVASQLKDISVDGDTTVVSRSDLLRSLGGEVDRPLDERLRSLLALFKDRGKRLLSRTDLSSQQRSQTERRKKQLSDHFGELSRLVKRYSGMSLLDLYKDFWAWSPGALSSSTSPVDWISIANWTLDALRRSTVCHEDIAPMLILGGLFYGFPREQTVHAILDEVQDYSRAEIEYIMRCLPQGCHMTVVGDPRQTLNPITRLQSLSALTSAFGPQAKYIRLNRGYRSSGEILEFAQRVCPDVNAIEAVRYTGDKPTVSSIGDEEALAGKLTETARLLLSSPFKTVAIICKTREEADRRYRQLRENLGASIALSDRDEFSQGLLVLPVFLAKGLEFDAVIIPDASATTYSSAGDRQLLYVACTRALHQLHLFCRGEVPDYLCG